MNLTLRFLVSAVILSGLAAFGWMLAIALTFAAESKTHLGFFERPETSLFGFAAAGILLAAWAFLQPRPNGIVWTLFGLAVCSLGAAALLLLR